MTKIGKNENGGVGAEGQKQGLFQKLFAQVVKFGIVGVIAFVIDYGLFLILRGVFGYLGMPDPWHYLIANLISFSVSVIFNYIASMRYVFVHKEDMSRRKEFIIFVVLSVIGLGLNELILWFGAAILGIWSAIAKLIATVLVMVFNFVTRKKFLDAS
ncbi:MAG: GtrA family protein [Coriobacteriales bacterium]|jgi:putative flippase GtrA|nr:GtrA family protein [Coriobacteriales bacterium]